MLAQTRWPPTKEGQLKNLTSVRDRKYKKTQCLIRHARKVGQIRALNRVAYLVKQEIDKELKDLALIEQDIELLNE